MAEPIQSAIELRFSDGSTIVGVLSLKHKQAFKDPVGSLDFEVAPPQSKVQEYRERLQKGETVGFLIDGKLQTTMMIETVSTSLGGGGPILMRVECVSMLRLLMESSAKEDLSEVLESDGPVRDLVEKALVPYGPAFVIADDDTGHIQTKTGKAPGATKTDVTALKIQEARVQPNETTYGFLARILTRLGVMLQMPFKEIVIITKPHYDGGALYNLTMPNFDGTGPKGTRFFGSITERTTNAGQPQLCEVRGNPTDKPGEKTAGRPIGTALTTDINSSRPPYRAGDYEYKPLIYRDTSCRDAERAENVAFLNLGLKAERSYTLTGNVAGLVSEDGTPWTVDTLVQVYVGPLGINEKMWISERTFHVSKQGGQHTSLRLIPPGNLVLGSTK